jgi:hypothetical protein
MSVLMRNPLSVMKAMPVASTPSPSAYTTYTISFPDSTTKRMSPGFDVENVLSDASILVACS